MSYIEGRRSWSWSYANSAGAHWGGQWGGHSARCHLSNIGGVAKSEDAPTREVTAAAKGGEVATCKNMEKNDLFMSRLESKMQKWEKWIVAVHCTIYQFIMCGGGGEGASLCGANKHIICVFMTLNLNLQNWKLILQLCDKSEKCPLPWPSVSRDSLLANFKRRVSRQLKSCNPFLPCCCCWHFAKAAENTSGSLPSYMPQCKYSILWAPLQAQMHSDRDCHDKFWCGKLSKYMLTPRFGQTFYGGECITEKTGKFT